jgi:membrane protein implicated in regulation of membrane protease activity
VFIIWIVAAAVLLAIEVHTTAFYAVFIAAGLVGGAVVDILGGPLWLQLMVIGAISVAGVLGARPPLVRLMRRRQPDLVLAGVQNIVGQRAMTVDIVGDEHHPGHALLAGERWLAIAADGGALPADVQVIVTGLRGTTLVVRPSVAIESS